MDEARFRRTTATCIWGVSDPENPSRDRDRGVAEGVAHAPDVAFPAADIRADGDAGGTERRPPTPHRTHRLRRTSADSVAPSPWVDFAAHAPVNSLRGGGTLLPCLCSPLSHRSGRSWRDQGGAIRRLRRPPHLSPDLAHRARRIVPRAVPDRERTSPLRRRTAAAGNLTGTNRSDG